MDACHATITNWEKSYTEPHVRHIPLICNFLGYCPLIEPLPQHFGHQLRNYRIFTIGKTIFELATSIGIDEGTLSEIEQTNSIRYTHVLNSINQLLHREDWQFSGNSKPEFIPRRTKCSGRPKFHAPANLPKTLGEHIALKRKQLYLTQVDVMQKLGVVSASAFRSWECYGVQPKVKYYPKIMEFLGYCPVQYPTSEGQRLKLIREHIGLSFRQVDSYLSLSTGCTYRTESGKYLNRDTTQKLYDFYRNVT